MWHGVSVDYEGQADVKVFVVDYSSQADLNVYKVRYSGQVRGTLAQHLIPCRCSATHTVCTFCLCRDVAAVCRPARTTASGEAAQHYMSCGSG